MYCATCVQVTALIPPSIEHINILARPTYTAISKGISSATDAIVPVAFICAVTYVNDATVKTITADSLARLSAVIVLTVASFTYVTAQINATGTIASVALDIPFEIAVYVGLASILMCSMLGGMRAVTWTQVAQYIVLIIAYLLPVFWISNKMGAGVFPHFMLADEVARIAELEAQFGLGEVKNSAADLKQVPKGLSGITKAHAEVNTTPWKFISLAVCMMAGTASLPHVMMRYFTTPSVKAARRSVGWSLFFIFLLYSSAPMLATLSKLSLMDPNLATGIIGKSISEVQAIDWYQNWNQANLMFVSDFNGNGTLELNEFFMGGKAVVLATPEIAGLPYVISGLVAAGGMAAAMSTADGLVLAISNALSHDIYYKMINPRAETAKRLIVARVLLVLIGFAGATIAAAIVAPAKPINTSNTLATISLFAVSALGLIIL